MFGQKIIIVLWFVIVAYDLFLSLPTWTFLYVIGLWFITIFLALIYFNKVASPTMPYKALSVIVFSYVIIVSFGLIVGETIPISSYLETFLSKRASAFSISIFTCLMTALLVCVPLAKLYCKSFLPWLSISCVPAIYFLSMPLFSSSRWFPKFISLLETMLVPFLIWLAVTLILRVLTSHSTRSPDSAGASWLNR